MNHLKFWMGALISLSFSSFAQGAEERGDFEITHDAGPLLPIQPLAYNQLGELQKLHRAGASQLICVTFLNTIDFTDDTQEEIDVDRLEGALFYTYCGMQEKAQELLLLNLQSTSPNITTQY